MLRSNKIPKVGDIRVVSKFMLFPKTIHGMTIWMESARIVQKYSVWEGCGSWNDDAWVIDSDKKRYFASL